MSQKQTELSFRGGEKETELVLLEKQMKSETSDQLKLVGLRTGGQSPTS